jgi:hypothetical protein
MPILKLLITAANSGVRYCSAWVTAAVERRFRRYYVTVQGFFSAPTAKAVFLSNAHPR